MMQMNELTQKEENAIKDILKAIGRDDNLNHQFANTVGMSVMEFNDVADKIFEKLGNGRISFDSGGSNSLL